MNALVSLGILFVILASIHLWVLALLRAWTREPLVSPDPKNDVPWGLSDILVAIVFQMVVHSAAHEWFRRERGLSPRFELQTLSIEHSSTYVGLMAGASLIAMALTIGWLLIRHRPSLAELGIRIRSIGLDFVLGVRAFVMLAPIVYAIQFVLVQFVESEHPLIELLKENPSSRFFVMSGFAAVIVAPLVEELFFRLLLQGWFERLGLGMESSWCIFFGGRRPESPPSAELQPDPSGSLVAENSVRPEATVAIETISPDKAARRNLRWPIIVSAALFALAHASNGPDPVPLFVLALGLGYLYQTTRRILPSVIVHVLLNGTTLTMMWLALNQSR